MIGVWSADPADLSVREARVASDAGRLPFGVGLIAWALQYHPEQLDVTIAAHPTLVSMSQNEPIRGGGSKWRVLKCSRFL